MGAGTRSGRLVDGAVVAYALWTATCHLVVLSGGNVRDLMWSSAGLVLLAGAALAHPALRRRLFPASSGASPDPPPAPAAPSVGLQNGVLLGVASAGVLVTWLAWQDGLRLWIAAVLYLALAVVLCLREVPPRGVAPRPAWPQESLVWVLACGSAFLALYGHRWRSDDCYYINLAVTMVDRPDLPLLTKHTIHLPIGPESNGVFFPYRVHSFEALGGMIAYLTGIEAISVIHLGLAAGFAFLLPLSLAHLFRLIDEWRWPWMVLAAMCIFVFEGTSGLGFGNQGIVRMFTGKSALLSVAIPMVVRYGLALGLAPSVRGLGLLLAAQVTAVGLSSTALWLAPVAAMLAVAAPLAFDRNSLRALGLGLLSCTYVVLLALWVRSAIVPEDAPVTVVAVAEAAGKAPFKPRVGLVNWWLRKIFEEPHVIQAYVAVMLMAIPLSRTALARRYMAVFLLGLTLFFLNPYLGDWVRYNITGEFTGQRGLWLAPVPAAVAIVFSSVIPDRGSGVRKLALGLVAFVAGLTLFFTLVPTRAVFSRDNQVALNWPPEPKVPRRAFAMARHLTELLPPDAQVLAADLVSVYLPTLHSHPHPLLANAKYMRAGSKEEKRRERLVRWVSKEDKSFPESEQQTLIDALHEYRIAAVVVSRAAKRTQGLSAALTRAGYRRTVHDVEDYQLWLPRVLPQGR